MALTAGLSTLLAASHATAQDDPWLGVDKAEHFGASAVIAAGGYAVGSAAFDRRTEALALGAGLALSAGVGKEIYDATGHGNPSWRDLTWDVAGTATGLVAAWLVDRFVLGQEAAKPSSSASTTCSGAMVTLRF